MPGFKRCGVALGKPGNVEEYVAPAVVGAQETESLGFKVGDYRTNLFAGSPISGAAFRGALTAGAATFVANSLLNQCQIIFGEFRGGEPFRWAS